MRLDGSIETLKLTVTPSKTLLCGKSVESILDSISTSDFPSSGFDTQNERGTPSVFVSGLKPNGPAMKAGIRQGDQLIQIGQDRVQRSGEVLSSMRGKKPGEKLDLRVLRNGEILVIPVNLAERD